MLALDSGEISQAIEVCRQIAAKESKHGRDKVGSAITNVAMALARGHLTRLLEIEYLGSYPAGRRLLTRAKALLLPTVLRSRRSPTMACACWSLTLIAAAGRSSSRGIQAKPAWLKRREFVGPVGIGFGRLRDGCARARGSSRRIQWAGVMAGRAAILFAGLATFRPGTDAGSADPSSLTNLLVRKDAWNEVVALDASASWTELVEIVLKPCLG